MTGIPAASMKVNSAFYGNNFFMDSITMFFVDHAWKYYPGLIVILKQIFVENWKCKSRILSLLAIKCSKLTIEKPEEGVKYVQY